MGRYVISINQLAAFQKASEKGRANIIKQQKTPNPIKVSYYQLTKKRIKKSLEDAGAVRHIKDALAELAKRRPEKKNRQADRQVSMEALNRFLELKLPVMLKLPDIQFLKKADYKNSTTINGVDIIIAPDLIFTTMAGGRQIVGGLKLHVAKGSAFDMQQQQTIASGIYQYLKKEVAKDNQVVDPEWCISLDIFGNGFVRIEAAEADLVYRDKNIYAEIKRIWDAA